ncbi:hypothetical protein [Lysobacter sp. A3-1-A15]|uniref:hypothetical protein n=1 Tax=Novilysobacter viscosus TaxID=3098602 RepID=UPI002ED86367
MNASPTFARPVAAVAPRNLQAAVYVARRPRATGIGYGHSSGYGSTRQYANPVNRPLFRFA